MVASLSEFSQCSDTIHRQMVQLLMKALIQRIPSLNWNPVIRNMFPDAVWGSLENVDDQYVNVLPNVTEQDVYDLQNDLLIAVAKLMGPSGNLLGDYNEKDGLFLISNPSLGVTRERTWFELSLEKFFKRVGTDFQQALYPLNILYLEVISGGGLEVLECSYRKEDLPRQLDSFQRSRDFIGRIGDRDKSYPHQPTSGLVDNPDYAALYPFQIKGNYRVVFTTSSVFSGDLFLEKMARIRAYEDVRNEFQGAESTPLCDLDLIKDGVVNLAADFEVPQSDLLDLVFLIPEEFCQKQNLGVISSKESLMSLIQECPEAVYSVSSLSGMLMGNRVRIRDRSDSRDLGFVNTVACSDSCLWNVSIEQSSGVNSGQLIVTDFTLGGSMCYRAMVPAYFHYYNQEADPGDTVVALPDGFVVVLKGQDNATLCKEISSGILEKRPG